MLKLTPRQAEILAFIKRCLDDNGYPPTRAEIAQELGFKSPNAAEEHLKALARKGAIEMWPPVRRFSPNSTLKNPATSTRPSSILALITCCGFMA
jgi:SOS-response transcriptional repressor LexA